jgi:prepilin-type N-terminal cleavage/methylation domain-containing protein
MDKKGFTLVELLVVGVIIAVLSIVIVPSVININKNINKRLLSEKIENIESSAVLYANNNEEIFNGTDVVYIYVYELVDSNYMTVDVTVGSENCNASLEKTSIGCVINPTNKKSINNNYVILRKEGTGVKATYVDTTQVPEGETNQSATLVDAVCAGFANGTFRGQAYSGGSIVECSCNQPKNPTKLVIKNTSTQVNACLIAGENVNNYLKYGDTKANWRVLGVYDLDGTITAKMITSDPV